MDDQQDSDLELALEERRNPETSAEPSGRLAEGTSTKHAVKGLGESWDQENFKRKPGKKGTEEACMIEILEKPGKYLQAYFLDWSATEVLLRIPMNDGDERREWVNLKSSRLWRGPMSTNAWKYDKSKNGFWLPKAVKGKPGKKKKITPTGEPSQRGAKPNESGWQRLSGLEMQTARQASLDTPSGSQRTLRSHGWKFERDDDANLEISSQDQGPESEDPTDGQQIHDDAATGQTKAERQDKIKASEFMANWQKGHLQALAEKGQLNMPIAENCNWESGNLDALRRSDKKKDNLNSRSSGPSHSHQVGGLDGRQASKALKDSSQGAHTGPRSPSPSTPNKARHGNRVQNSSSEDADLRSAAQRARHGDKVPGKQGFPSLVSASSPRSIDNMRAQQERKLSAAWKHDDRHDQNSGSSSSSGRISGDTPNTVLTNGNRREHPSLTQKGTQQKRAFMPNLVRDIHAAKGCASTDGAAMPLKKRAKLALVELDPFASK